MNWDKEAGGRGVLGDKVTCDLFNYAREAEVVAATSPDAVMSVPAVWVVAACRHILAAQKSLRLEAKIRRRRRQKGKSK